MTAEFRYPAHRYIELLGAAAAHSRLRLSLTHFQDIPLARLVSRTWITAQLIRPFLLVVPLWRRRKCDLVIVREFISVPLLLAAPVLWWFRRRTRFVLVHNVQMATVRRRDRFALRALDRLGFRFIAIESAAGLAEAGLDPDRVLVLPQAHDASIVAKPSPSLEGRRPIVGIVGRPRPEKRMGASGHYLFDIVAGLDADILIGSPDAAVRQQARARGWQVVDTTSEAGYDRALRTCDVLLLDYDPARYRYRTSGVLTDAVFRGTAVVCPDYPVLRAQIATPERVGATFGDYESLPAAIDRAAAIARQGPAPFVAYARHRSPEMIASAIDEFVARRGDTDQSAR